MASIPDPGNPGDLPPAASDQDIANVSTAIGAGYSYGAIAQYHDANGMDAPPRPSPDALWSGQPLQSIDWANDWTRPTANTTLPPSAYQLDTPDQAREQINQLAESGAGVGAIESVGATAIKGAIAAVTDATAGSRAASMGVTTSVDALAAAPSELDATLGNKWVRRGAGGLVAAAVLHVDGLGGDPDQWDKDFASQKSMVNRGLTDEQNRRNR